MPATRPPSSSRIGRQGEKKKVTVWQVTLFLLLQPHRRPDGGTNRSLQSLGALRNHPNVVIDNLHKAALNAVTAGRAVGAELKCPLA